MTSSTSLRPETFAGASTRSLPSRATLMPIVRRRRLQRTAKTRSSMGSDSMGARLSFTRGILSRILQEHSHAAPLSQDFRETTGQAPGAVRRLAR